MEGRKNKLYYNAGTYATPTWTLIGRISGLKRTQNRSTSEYAYREAANKKTATGQITTELSFKYETKRAPTAADTVFAALLDSFTNDTVLDIACTDQAIGTSGAKGIRGPFVVTQFDRDEADESNTAYDVTLKEVDHEESGSLVEVAAYATP